MESNRSHTVPMKRLLLGMCSQLQSLPDFRMETTGKIHTVETHLIGNYNLDNALVAVAVGRFFKIPAERISRAIAAYEPTNNRSQLKKTENNETDHRCLQRKSEQHESRFRQFRHNACLAQSSHLR